MKNPLHSLVRIGLLQIKPTTDKLLNVQRAVKTITKLVKNECVRLVMLPECFNCPAGPKHWRDYAECIPDGTTSQHLSRLAEVCNIYVVGGTIPEIGDDQMIYNTCTVWDPDGDLVATHRKLHNFAEAHTVGVNSFGANGFKSAKKLKNSLSTSNSEKICIGEQLTVFEMDGHAIGVGVGSDIRFEEMARIYRNVGCQMIVYPASFNLNSGPLHWELLQRARANDNQLYVVTTATARDPLADFISFGHSMIVDPWARVLQRASEDEEIIVADIDFSLVDELRRQVPLFERRRLDLYRTESYASSQFDERPAACVQKIAATPTVDNEPEDDFEEELPAPTYAVRELDLNIVRAADSYRC